MKLQKITPNYARELLQYNTVNRPIRKTHVKALAKEIVDGKWILTNASIGLGVDKNGNKILMDGQHRLAAIIEANKAVESYIVHDLAEESFKAIDLGQRRSAGDALSIYSNGELRDTIKMAAALRITRTFHVNEGFFTEPKTYGKRMTPDETIEIYKTYPNVVGALQSTYDMTHSLLYLTHAVIAGLKTYMGAHAPVQCELFWEQFENGTRLEKGSPVLALRNDLNSLLARRMSKLGKRDMIGYVVTAWNNYINGDEVYSIDFSPEEKIFMQTPE